MNEGGKKRQGNEGKGGKKQRELSTRRIMDNVYMQETRNKRNK
jgi:hypothetical protein